MTKRGPWCLVCDKPVESFEWFNHLRAKPRRIVQEHQGFEVVGRSITVRCHGATHRQSFTMHEAEVGEPVSLDFFAPEKTS